MKRDLVFGPSFAVLFVPILLSVLAYILVKSNKKNTQRIADNIGDSSSSPTSTGSNNYDVFLSFSGMDTRKQFADHLYKCLVNAGIYVFRDGNELREGEKFGINLLQAIKNSKISIPILSRNYASSKWCLQELVQMKDCMKSGHIVLPIFYQVEPADVRHQKGSFGKIFSRLSGKHSEEDVATWKQALKEVASLTGWESEKTADGHEGELVEKVVGKVLSELKKAFQLVVTEQLVGINNAVEDILRLLDGNPSATQIVGIHGMGGIGKTTLAKVIYNKLSDQFQHSSFIADIRESSQRKGISCLQSQLMHDILGMKDEVSNTDEGIKIMESRFKMKKVLILLDDVDNNDQLEPLIGKHDWFEMGSKIIITTRIRSVLDDAGVNCKYELKGIAADQSLILFSRHAFLRDSPPYEFESLSNEIVSTTEGLPLALEVIGSFLFGKKQAIWQEALKKLKQVPHEKVQEKLRISFDALRNEEKQIFLDIACFFIGTNVRIASYMWDACNFFPVLGIETLSLMSLIKIGDNHDLKMHDQLRDLGREIARQEDYDVPMNRRRLWANEEALEVLQRNKGIQKVRVQALRLDKNSLHNEFTTEQLETLRNLRFLQVKNCLHSEFTTEQFETLPNLRFLQVHDAKLIGDSKSLLPKLRWLKWSGHPASVATSFCLKKLVILDLSWSDISELWEGWSHLKVAKELKVLNLTGCHCLKVTPDISVFQNLEILVLEGCDNLEQIHHSIGEVKGLVSLNFLGCEKLRVLPEEMGKLEELKELNIGMTAIKEIPPCIGSLKKLEMLHAQSCKSLVGLPDSIGQLVNLSTLDLRMCDSLDRLPESIGSIVKLQHLSLGGEQNMPNWAIPFSFSRYPIPNSIGKPKGLTTWELAGTGIRELPESVGDLKNLKILDISDSKLSNLPSTIGKLSNLEELHASQCKSLEGEIPLGGLSSLKILELSWTGVSGFPNTFDELSRLEKLDLRGCKMLQSLPECMSKLPSLQHLQLIDCYELQSLPELPDCLTLLEVTCQHRTLPQLSHLIRLKELTIYSCHLLESMPELPSGILKLSVYGCDKLKELPSLSSSEFLSQLDIQRCHELTEIKGLEALKSLVRLSVCGSEKLSKLDGLEHAGSLRYLDMSSSLVNDDLVQARGLDKLKNLEELDISFCEYLIRPDISQLTHLKRLKARGCHNLVEIKGLERLKNLEELDIAWCTSI